MSSIKEHRPTTFSHPEFAIAPEISVVVPIYNEHESIPLLVEKIAGVAQLMEVSYELICVDDGSTDGSAELLKKLARERHDLRVILLRRNYGQTSIQSNHASSNYAHFGKS